MAINGRQIKHGNVSGQVLCLSQSSVSKRLHFLRTIGLSQADAASVVARCPSVLALDVDCNLWPKYNYLTEHLEGSAASIMSCPVYLTLSLKGRSVTDVSLF